MGAIRIGHIAGIEIRIHWSWLVVFVLVTWSLARGLEEIYDEWSATRAWVVSVITTVLFFASVLLHELSHSLVAKRLGLPVSSITLFIFGGVSSLGSEPATAKQEFQVAIVGPLTSFAVAIAMGVPAAILAASGDDNSPFFAIALHVAITNASVGVFNLLPGFPLDGGRVLRAGLWARTKNLLRATRWATYAGMGIGFLLIAAGVVSALLGSFVGGVWFIVIGLFLRNAAEQSYQQLVFRHTMEGTKVGEIVNRSYAGAPPDINLEQLVREYILGQSQRCVPIVVADDLLGIVTMSDLRKVPQEEWPGTSAFRAMTPKEKLHAVSPNDDLTRALEIMAMNDVHQLPVLQGRDFIGFVTRADVLRLIQIRTEISSARVETGASV